MKKVFENLEEGEHIYNKFSNEEIERKIDSIIYDLQRFMDSDCHAEMCHDCKSHVNWIERNLSKLKSSLKEK